MFVGSESMKKGQLVLHLFVGEGLIRQLFWGGVEVSLTLTPVVALQSALRFMSRRAHCVEAGINAVMLVCSPAHNSQSRCCHYTLLHYIITHYSSSLHSWGEVEHDGVLPAMV